MRIQSADEMIKANLIVKHYAGSHSYGTSTPESDIDFRGIFVANPVNIRTPFFPIEEVTDTTEQDTKIYELNQFMKLALECNPNIIETLWIDQEDITFSTPAYQHLRAHREKLLSSKIAFTTSGYALSQLKRIKGHNKWINQPQPIEAPQQVDYISLVHNFTSNKFFKIRLRQYHSDYRLIPFAGDTFGLYPSLTYTTYNATTGNLNTDYEGDTHQFGTPLFIIKFNRAEYLAAKEIHTNYWTWKNNRNQKRSALEEQFGIDTKHAMHLVRLLRIGIEALTEGVIKVKRPDAKELLEIRNGAWTYQQIVAYAEEMDKYVREDLYLKTTLPKKPDIKFAAQLIIDIQDMIWTT